MDEQKAIFLDRDGVINEVLNERVKFVNEPEQLFILDGVATAIKKFNDARYKVFVVTNQGGIGLGYMTTEQLERIHEQMKKDLAKEGARIDDIAFCPHKPYEGCPCRKPSPKMLLDLAMKHQIDLKRSYMVGDRAPDIEAGQRAGTKTVHIGARETNIMLADHYFSNLRTFSDWLLPENESSKGQ